MKQKEIIEENQVKSGNKAIGGLASRIARLTETGSNIVTTEVPGLDVFRRNEVTEPVSVHYPPSICLIAQGSKRIELGGDILEYDPAHYLITSAHVLTMAQITRACETEPYLGLRLTLDMRELTKLMTESELPPPRGSQSGRGMAVGSVTIPMIEAFQRLIDLTDQPEDIPILSPVIQREIAYRLLTGDQGARLRQIISTGSQRNQIARATEWLKENFAQQIKIEDLASRVGMSLSTFHHHFREVTALSPLQFQKQLRLQEAKRLMISENLDASTAAFEVGYESPSQFSREYKNLFGASPMRDIKELLSASAM